MLGLATALGLALAAQGERPIRADCLDVRRMLGEVSLTGRIVPRFIERPPIGPNGERNPPPTLVYDLLLEPTICVDDGQLANPDDRVARVGLYAHDPAIEPRISGAGERRVRVRGRQFTSFSVDGLRPIMVIEVAAVEPVER